MLDKLAKSLGRIAQNRDAKMMYNSIPYLYTADAPSGLDSLTIHEKNIEDILTAWSFSRIEVPGDGDCFFAAVGQNLANREDLQQILKLTGDVTLSEITKQLRKLLVDEWLGDHKQEYICFFVCDECDEQKKLEIYTRCACEFLVPGFYQSALGDAMPLGMANALKLPIVIFTSKRESPVLCITPQETMSTIPIFVTLNYFDSGHYDYAVFSGKLTMPPPARRYCNCGLSTKEPRKSCVENMSYRSRCKCLKGRQRCTEKCRCKNCSNPYGQRPQICRMRKRQPHKWQESFPSTQQFILERGGSLYGGQWSAIEHYIFTEVVQQFQNCLDEKPPVTLTNAFNEVIRLSLEWDCADVVLKSKSSTQITSKVRYYKAQCELHRQLQQSGKN